MDEELRSMLQQIIDSLNAVKVAIEQLGRKIDEAIQDDHIEQVKDKLRKS